MLENTEGDNADKLETHVTQHEEKRNVNTMQHLLDTTYTNKYK